MFSLLEAKQDIAIAQRKLEVTLKRDLPKRYTKDISYPGGTTHDARVFADENHWFRSANYVESVNPRRLNWFGLFSANKVLQITVEINTPYKGRNDQVAGFFALDNSTGTIYLMHSGRVGGATKGVGKAPFLAWSNLPPVSVVDSSGGIRDGVLVMPIEGLAASRSAIRYVDTIARFKQAVRNGELATAEFKRKLQDLKDFYAEARGRRRGQRSGEIDYISRQGDVVDALYEWRQSNPMPKGARIVKNVLIDMGVAVSQELIEIFEVKTSTARPDIYSAIGQLMVHGTGNDCRRVIVLPRMETVADDLGRALKRLRIDLLQFDLDEEKATIIDAGK